MGRHFIVCSALALPALLCGCDAQLTVDLTDGPTDDADQVVLAITHVALQTDSGSIKRFALDDATPVDLLLFRKGETFRLIGGETLDTGKYTGIALDFDTDGSFVKQSDGTEVTINPPVTRTFAPIDLDIGNLDDERVVLALSLRFSLVDPNTGEYELDPVLRAVRPGNTGVVTGAVATTLVESAGCANGRPFTEGVAVYAFKGSSATPNDYAGQATLIDAADVEANSAGTAYAYELHFLPAGDYTLALTCQADDDDPASDDAVAFEDQGNVTVTAGATAQLDFQ